MRKPTEPYDPNQAVREKTAMDVLSDHGLGWLDDDRPRGTSDVYQVLTAAAHDCRELGLLRQYGRSPMEDEIPRTVARNRELSEKLDALVPEVEKDDGKIHTIADIEEVIDNWQHRSEMMKCRTCMWYVPKRGKGRREIGRCRQSSPTIKGWPAIYPDDWCGAHKLDETRL